MGIKVYENELLSKVHIFQLDRLDSANGEWLFINVNEILTGQDKGRFVAIPNRIIENAPEKYFCVGSSIEEALNGCLERIRGKSLDVIFPGKEG